MSVKALTSDADPKSRGPIIQTSLRAWTSSSRRLAFGWINGHNVQLDIRWGLASQIIEVNARELVGLKPDVILAGPTNAVLPLRQMTRDIPIVFISVSDPIGHGIVENLARPAGNLTGSATLNRR